MGVSPVIAARPEATLAGQPVGGLGSAGGSLDHESVWTSAGRARRQLPLRARSSTGWAGGALSYDGGLKAHKHSRAAPKCPGLPVLLVGVVVGTRVMVQFAAALRPEPGSNA